ncbi:MAG: hypothetical protein L0241_23820, partial [Planctomycetia bacterium]|nr:hypothetical protein [Planctomycetia bacterium]
FNMVKKEEVKQVFQHNRFHIFLMLYTAVMVIVTDFLTGVLSAIIIYAVLYRFFDRAMPPAATSLETARSTANAAPSENGNIPVSVGGSVGQATSGSK